MDRKYSVHFFKTMKRKYIKILKIIIFSFMLITAFSGFVNASSLTDKLSSPGAGTSQFLKVFEKPVTAIATLASYASVGALIVIGIKYMEGSAEDKAHNKEYLINYTIGAALAFGTSNIINAVLQFTGDATIESLAGRILYLITFFASVVSLVVLIYIGIKYMTGSVGEKANYKASMMPYIIGCILVFGASGIASMFFKLFSA